MKTIFCLVSRQAMANVLPVLMFKPKRVVLFATPEEITCANNLERLFITKNIEVARKDNLDAYDYSNFHNVIKSELEADDDDVTLNVTGGTKLMALAAYKAFSDKNKTVIYCDTKHKKIIHLFPKLDTENLNLDLSVNDYLIAYGYDIISTRTSELDEDYIKLFNTLIKKQLLLKFSKFLDKFRSDTGKNEKVNTTINDTEFNIFKIQKTQLGYTLFIHQEKFKYNDDKFLKGGWLEFLMHYHLKKLKINSELGVKIKSSNDVENEIDLIFIKDYQLHLISCKSGRQDRTNQDIYELDTLRKIAGGIFGKAYLFTTKTLTQGIEKRAKELNIQLIDLKNLFTLQF
jgi:hypothetical protein